MNQHEIDDLTPEQWRFRAHDLMRKLEERRAATAEIFVYGVVLGLALSIIVYIVFALL